MQAKEDFFFFVGGGGVGCEGWWFLAIFFLESATTSLITSNILYEVKVECSFDISSLENNHSVIMSII